MRPREAIREGLRDAFRFGGTMSRPAYLWFLAAALPTFVAALWAAALLFPDAALTACVLVLAVFYIPVTTAGARRLRDAGFDGRLMLRPLAPVAGITLTLGLFGLLPGVGGAAFLAVVLMPRLALLALGLCMAIAFCATLVAVSDVMSRLLMPPVREGAK
ncbi:MAG: DUF805 domain-containing protein [Rhodobacteraceae bacterium]|nr:DUF805 domain-containing protein [Paracoccaceae bacterium]MBR9820631.1 DUF805 domain-containing protein [Paracoccaceae bacterium]